MGFTLCTAPTRTKHMIFSNVPKVSQICGLECRKSIKLSGTQGLSLSLQKGGVPAESSSRTCCCGRVLSRKERRRAGELIYSIISPSSLSLQNWPLDLQIRKAFVSTTDKINNKEHKRGVTERKATDDAIDLAKLLKYVAGYSSRWSLNLHQIKIWRHVYLVVRLARYWLKMLASVLL